MNQNNSNNSRVINTQKPYQTVVRPYPVAPSRPISNPNSNNMKKKNKSSVGRKAVTVLCTVLLVGSASASCYFLYKALSNKQNTQLIDTSPFVTQRPFEDLSKNAKPKLLSNTFSIQLTRRDDYNSKKNIRTFGTAWSFHMTRDSWYLLTNYHVVMDYLHSKGFDSHTNTIPYTDFDLYRTRSNFNTGNPVDGTDPSLHTSDNEVFTEAQLQNAKIQIIVDNQWTNDSFKLFSDKSNGNFYSLDMAMIKITSSSIIEYLKNSDLFGQYLNDPFDVYKSNRTIQQAINPDNVFKPLTKSTYSLDNESEQSLSSSLNSTELQKENKTSVNTQVPVDYNDNDIVIGGFPVRGTRYITEIGQYSFPTQYFLEVIESNKKNKFYYEKFWNENWYPEAKYDPDVPKDDSYIAAVRNAKALYESGEVEAAEMKLNSIPEQWRLLQYGNVMVSATPYLEKDRANPKTPTQWFLSGGASGSPVYIVPSSNGQSFRNVAPYWAPIGIYWGGLSSLEGKTKEMIQPSFSAFISNLPGSSYNIYENFETLINDGYI